MWDTFKDNCPIYDWREKCPQIRGIAHVFLKELIKYASISILMDENTLVTQKILIEL